MMKIMRPLVHPSIGDNHRGGHPACPVRSCACRDLCRAGGLGRRHHLLDFLQVSDRSIPKSTLSQHFRALREAGLILSERHGVEMRNISRCKEIERRFPGLIAAILNAHSVQATGRTRVAKRKPAARKTKAV